MLTYLRLNDLDLRSWSEHVWMDTELARPTIMGLGACFILYITYHSIQAFRSRVWKPLLPPNGNQCWFYHPILKQPYFISPFNIVFPPLSTESGFIHGRPQITIPFLRNYVIGAEHLKYHFCSFLNYMLDTNDDHHRFPQQRIPYALRTLKQWVDQKLAQERYGTGCKLEDWIDVLDSLTRPEVDPLSSHAKRCIARTLGIPSFIHTWFERQDIPSVEGEQWLRRCREAYVYRKLSSKTHPYFTHLDDTLDLYLQFEPSAMIHPTKDTICTASQIVAQHPTSLFQESTRTVATTVETSSALNHADVKKPDVPIRMPTAIRHTPIPSTPITPSTPISTQSRPVATTPAGTCTRAGRFRSRSTSPNPIHTDILQDGSELKNETRYYHIFDGSIVSSRSVQSNGMRTRKMSPVLWTDEDRTNACLSSRSMKSLQIHLAFLLPFARDLLNSGYRLFVVHATPFRLLYNLHSRPMDTFKWQTTNLDLLAVPIHDAAKQTFRTLFDNTIVYRDTWTGEGPQSFPELGLIRWKLPIATSSLFSTMRLRFSETTSLFCALSSNELDLETMAYDVIEENLYYLERSLLAWRLQEQCIVNPTMTGATERRVLLYASRGCSYTCMYKKPASFVAEEQYAKEHAYYTRFGRDHLDATSQHTFWPEEDH